MNANSKNIISSNLPNWQFVTMMLVGVIFWSLAFPCIKIGLHDLSFVNLTIMRFFVVSIVFITIILLQSKRFSKLQKQDVIPIFLLGIIGVMTYHLGLNYGEQFISAGAASLIIATIPILILIFSIIFLNEQINFKKIFGISLALCGVIVISIWGTEDASIEIEYIYAALAVLLAAIMGAFYTISGKKLLKRYNGLSLTAYAMLFGSLGLIPFINKSLFDEVATMSTTSWIVIIFLGVCSTVIGYAIWYVALKMKTASELSIYLYIIPVFSTVFSYFLFDDKITVLYVLGGILVIVGLIIVNTKNKIETQATSQFLKRKQKD
jgi:drug/metabolite transporter (DMT)-like permease